MLTMLTWVRPLFVSPALLPKAGHHAKRKCWVCQTGRREVLRTLSALPTLLLAKRATGNVLLWPRPGGPSPRTVFSVRPPSLSSVSLESETLVDVLKDVSAADAVLLGEHHSSLVDHLLQARIVEELAECGKPVVVGLEMVQQRFQGALDRYCSRKIDELELFLETEWDSRWAWPYESYLPLLRTCRAHHIPLIALSMNSESLVKARAKGGIANLSNAEMRAYIADPAAFVDLSREPAFKLYVNECITPSYAAHARMGLLEQTANFNSFYTARVLRDEAMASCAASYLSQHPNTLFVGVMGADHVKFHYGVSARMQRLLENMDSSRSVPELKVDASTSAVKKRRVVRTVVLNPSPADAFDPKDGSLKLELTNVNRKGIGVTIADYLWFSSPDDAKPRRHTTSQRLPPVEELVLPERVVYKDQNFKD